MKDSARCALGLRVSGMLRDGSSWYVVQMESFVHGSYQQRRSYCATFFFFGTCLIGENNLRSRKRGGRNDEEGVRGGRVLCR